MAICVTLLIVGLFLGLGVGLLEWKMPGFIKNSIRNGVANGRAFRERREKIKARGGGRSESLVEFSKGLGRTVAFQPPPESEKNKEDMDGHPGD